MEQNNISLQYGIHRTPSLGADGELSECVNLIPQNGELVNIQEPIKMEFDEQGESYMANATLKNIHTYGDDDVYFYYINSSVRYSIGPQGEYDDFQGSAFSYDGTTAAEYSEDVKVVCYGNIVILIEEDKADYYIFKADEFKYLGDQIPRINLNFGLYLIDDSIVYADEEDNRFGISVVFNGTAYPETYFGIKYPSGDTGSVQVNRDGEINEFIPHIDGTNPRKNTTEGVLAAVNYYLNKAYKDNQFVEPFLVRYAYRLYDETTILASDPVLMIPSTRPVPEVFPYDRAISNNMIKIALLGSKCGLDYQQVGSISTETKAAWKDVIKSVDIYVSAPLRQYDQSKDVEKAEEIPLGTSRGFYGAEYSARNPNEYDGYYRERVRFTGPAVTYALPTFKEEVFNRSVRECSQFYLIKSIPFTDFGASGRFRIEMDDGTLESLTTRETLKDTGIPSDLIVPKNTFEYNNRLHLYNIRQYIYNGDPMRRATQFINAKMVEVNDTFVADDSEDSNLLLAYNVEKNGREYLVGNAEHVDHKIYPYGTFYIYHPDPDVSEVQVRWDDNGTVKVKRHEMNRHTLLSGSVYFEGFGSNWTTSKHIARGAAVDSSIPTLTTGLLDRAHSYTENDRSIFISAESNPFLINPSSVVTLSSKILCVSNTAKALSQGQYGQFPLYVFCKNGIWSLYVSDEGAYIAKQPVSRDVLTNVGSVTQIDNAVVFVTNQGLKIIQGSEVALLSTPVEGLNLNETFIKDAVDKFWERYGSTSELINPYVSDASQFVTQIQTAKIVYDYAHNLLHVFFEEPEEEEVETTTEEETTEVVTETEETTETETETETTTEEETPRYKHYVYSFDTKQWANQVLPEQLVTSVPGYPLTTMQFDNALYQYDKTADGTMRIGYALTRPLALGNPLARKALYDLRVVGQKTSQHSLRRVAVWVSNDNVNWHRLTSLKALSAKYYRFLIMTHHNDIDTVSGLALQYDERYNHKMRGH